MGKDNYILNIIDEIISILEKNEYRKNRYNNDIEWFERREKIYKSNAIRVAIMGITSSGKSTLVNALLGEKILPMAIRPSSSIIITASKGENRQATVYFKDKAPEILRDNNFNEDVISQYADESKNPNNRLNVTQIDVKTPNFILKENIHIIDSPGLDAWNLENHEKLTLEILLPTIDICVFVTTVKANSDGTNAEKIKIVSEKEKRIILAQNMIDSIEEKIGRNGIIEEDKATILKKHKKRAEKLLREVTENEEKYDVIQISALNALNGILNKDEKVYDSSNFNGFINTIENCADNTIPRLDGQRAISLIDKINNIIAADNEIIKGNDLDAIEELIKVQSKDIDKLVNAFENAQEEIFAKIGAIEEVISETINEITAVSSHAVEDYFDVIDRINNKNLYIESDILNIVKKYEKEKKKIYDKLNLDIRFSYILPSVESKNVEIKHKYEERTMLFKKDGVLNKGKRFLSNIFDREWGYKEVGYDEKIVDKDATIEMAKNICNQNKIRYIDILKEWGNQYRKTIDIFYNEVDKRAQEYEEKKSKNIELYDIEEVNKSLAAIKDELLSLKSQEQNEAAIEINNYEKKVFYNIPKLYYNLYTLSNKIYEENYLLIGKYMRNKSKEKIEVFWTWDIDSCIEFVSRIYGVNFNDEQYEIIKKEGIYSFQNIVIIYELCENKLDFHNKLKIIKAEPLSVYIVFNGIQIGNSKKQILESRYLNYFFKDNSNFVVNLVIDSSREFINANNVQELLLEVKSLEKSILNRYENIKPKYMLINSKNPIYNMALIEGQEKEQFLISDYKTVKEKLFENPLSRGKEEKETLEAILSYFLNIAKDAR
ncbi:MULTISPECIES: dynamin family protein [unclassified Clostridium]|uniref:dynamin family protein n=1 Tax=unclassified Clostridium TaxID=2614128 RepID=UPI000297C199|nr:MULTISPECIES: dynamin family protein [unclassified Clostridium]EKQ55212.1 MAG: GTPase [Clostridium sp. Maddingley MBC34-26]